MLLLDTWNLRPLGDLRCFWNLLFRVLFILIAIRQILIFEPFAHTESVRQNCFRLSSQRTVVYQVVFKLILPESIHNQTISTLFILDAVLSRWLSCTHILNLIIDMSECTIKLRFVDILYLTHLLILTDWSKEPFSSSNWRWDSSTCNRLSCCSWRFV